MPARRELLKAGLIGLTSLGLPGLGLAAKGPAGDWLFSAADDAEGHRVLGYVPATGERFRIGVSERCHGGCRRPGRTQAVLFARRPGRSMHVIDTTARRELARIEAPAGHHFYGHGVFSPEGRHLYATVNRIADGAGLIHVFDAQRDYAHHTELDLQGIGPHELRLMPDGATLAVGLGGIRTHPDYGRVKLNLDDMAPALLMVDRVSGEVLERHAPSHPQLSCRHLDVGADGTLIAGYQFQGPAWERHPLLLRRGPGGDVGEIALPDGLTDELRHYTASIAVARDAPRVLVTAPRGHRVVLIDSRDGRLVASHALPDAAGALADGQGGFWVSSGRGDFYRVAADGAPPERLEHLALSWDNHLT
ncbi:DUF1513 domain-containing protein [Halomonas borealis]|uniref:DUF1513 domain-containing protein n=1 Tax=Halomonas borealis TaxID=2508710 RepID=UPI00109F8AF6|nr:DUF1513 domain-containing protein [Halomonas borealis]